MIRVSLSHWRQASAAARLRRRAVTAWQLESHRRSTASALDESLARSRGGPWLSDSLAGTERPAGDDPRASPGPGPPAVARDPARLTGQAQIQGRARARARAVKVVAA